MLKCMDGFCTTFQKDLMLFEQLHLPVTCSFLCTTKIKMLFPVYIATISESAQQCFINIDWDLCPWMILKCLLFQCELQVFSSSQDHYCEHELDMNQQVVGDSLHNTLIVPRVIHKAAAPLLLYLFVKHTHFMDCTYNAGSWF